MHACMYIYVCLFSDLLLVISNDNYFASFSLSRIEWCHSSLHIGSEGPQRGGGSPAGQRCKYRGAGQCKEMVKQAIGC
jgi:hypothetical protein